MNDVAVNTPRNIHLALQYDNQNQAELRVVARADAPIPVDIGGAEITLTGNVNIPGEVNVINTDIDPAIIKITQVGTSGVLSVPYLPIQGNVTIDNTNTSVLTATDIPTSYDAFGRHRVSEPFTLFDSSFRYTDNQIKWDTSNVGTSTYTFLPNEGLMNLSVSTALNDSVIRQTKRVFNYQPGKSLLIMNTFVMEPAKLGLRQRVGYFSTQNGIYVELDSSTVSLVIRKYNSGVVDDTSEKIAQGAWNGDRLNGLGGVNNLSGLTLDLTKSQIFWCDIEWLGVGSVRAGFVINGQFIVCHTFHHANILASTYMTTAILPVRYEITNTSGTDSSSNLKQICSTVISEGGYAATSRSRSASTTLTGKAVSDTNWTPMISIRLKSTRTQGVVYPSRLEVYGLESKAYKWGVFVGGTLGNAGSLTWTSAGNESFVEYNTDATTLTGGSKIDEGMFVGGTIGGPTSATPVGQTQDVQLTQLINGNVEILTVAVQATTNNDKAIASIVWEEYG